MYSVKRFEKAIDKGEIFTVYQPKVDLVSGDLLGVEALARWAHAQDGVIYPDEFIDLAVYSGKINKLARVIIRQAFKELRQWEAAGLELGLSLNVSMYNLVSDEFSGFLEQELKEFAVTPEAVTLEVKEAGLISDYDEAVNVISQVRSMGVRIAIDDFGSSGSTLMQLRELPIDEVKIERSFVTGAHSDPRLKALCEACINLATDLDLDLVASGIEDLEDYRFLVNAGCTLGQGYYISRPVRPGLIEGWLTVWRRDFARISRQLKEAEPMLAMID
ncbi:MAG: EAL domain-containing protein [Pseudohongiellaceae bacterium]